jgi:hypothetical protein
MVQKQFVTEALKLVEQLELRLFKEGADGLLQDEIACIRTELRMGLGLDPYRDITAE